MKKNSLKLDPQLSIVIGIFAISGLLVYFINKQAGTVWQDFALVLNNTFMNILIFGILLTWLEKKRRRRHINRGYLEQLEDFRFWRSEEGVWRKVGILRRLRNLEAQLPDLSGIEMENAMMESWDLTDLRLNHANFTNAFLWQSDVSRTSFERGIMERVYLENVTMDGTNFDKVYMVMADLREACGKKAQFMCTNLEMSIFNGARLEDCSFEGANLEKATFEGAVLKDCMFYHAHLVDCNFKDADLQGADFRQTDLSGCSNLSYAQLEQAMIDETTKLPLELHAEQEDLLKKMKQQNHGPVRAHFDNNVPHYRSKPNLQDHRRSRTILDHF
ncbi:pentapeptide repeat-containing protein [Acanthopleuribacter pedis]|uniref:Pentapeptide repeat-containing protein n=1 Tax=Acanthopleuribacter pedis TaxID=442870 RepID=A0A8J7Q6X4_9BACT|nr:pentapeptide repeat-containing protein [Acanthopleuribacter pedis]MBO1321682.1 pentapeptide repeat-containing protein [Acanthopleuribacter pedis]